MAQRTRSNLWTSRNKDWLRLDPYQRAAAMSLLEADGMRPMDARNALGAMVNRSKAEKVPLGDHVGQRIYQPSMEPAQERRLGTAIRHPAFPTLTEFARQREAGSIPDPVNGATHFLAPERTMLRLSGGVRTMASGRVVGNSSKYHSWPQWTGFDPSTGQYRGVVHRDNSHAFLTPGGRGRAEPPTVPRNFTDQQIAAEATMVQELQQSVSSRAQTRGAEVRAAAPNVSDPSFMAGADETPNVGPVPQRQNAPQMGVVDPMNPGPIQPMDTTDTAPVPRNNQGPRPQLDSGSMGKGAPTAGWPQWARQAHFPDSAAVDPVNAISPVDMVPDAPPSSRMLLGDGQSPMWNTKQKPFAGLLAAMFGGGGGFMGGGGGFGGGF